MKSVPQKVNLLTAGFPCQDLSQAGGTAGIFGSNSGLVWEVFRLIERARPPAVLFENVPFMLRLQSGEAMRALVTRLEEAGYSWAYRTVDAQSFGVPQRRPRVFLLGMLTDNPANILLVDSATLPSTGIQSSFGFYWTEGNRGIGWAINSLPALKGGSGIGIPSPPALIMPSGEIVTPHICDAERIQGFPPYWTAPAATDHGNGVRWRLIGNAVNVRVAAWIGRRFRRPGHFDHLNCEKLDPSAWPDAAFNLDGSRRRADVGRFPVMRATIAADSFLRFRPKLLSHRASSGVLQRLRASSLNPPPHLMESLQRHVGRMAAADA